jgi:RimJ/RimL family protein N-acetyltransferase
MLTIKAFRYEDANLIFNWRNDPYIVNLGSLKKTVTCEEHYTWFNRTLISETCKAYILEVDHIPAGQARFDLESESIAFISIYLIEQFSNKGLGIPFMELSCQSIFKTWPNLQSIIAIVRKENKIGQRYFLKANFIQDEQYNDLEHFGFSYRRPIN